MFSRIICGDCKCGFEDGWRGDVVMILGNDGVVDFFAHPFCQVMLMLMCVGAVLCVDLLIDVDCMKKCNFL